MKDLPEDANRFARLFDSGMWMLGVGLIAWSFDLTTLQLVGLAAISLSLRPWIPRDAAVSIGPWRR